MVTKVEMGNVSCSAEDLVYFWLSHIQFSPSVDVPDSSAGHCQARATGCGPKACKKSAGGKGLSLSTKRLAMVDVSGLGPERLFLGHRLFFLIPGN
jgi:hypothetical protein